MITGESRAVTKEPGDTVIAGTVAAGGTLRVRVTAAGDETALSGIMRLVAQAQASALAGPGAGRPGGGHPLLRRAGRGRRSRWSSGGAGRSGGGPGPHGDRAGHRLPACARAGDPAGDRHLDLTRRPQRAAGEEIGWRSSEPASRGHRHLRQDRHADPRPAGAGRRCRRNRDRRGRVQVLQPAVETDSEHPLARAIVVGADGPRPRRSRSRPASRRLPGRGARADVEGMRRRRWTASSRRPGSRCRWRSRRNWDGLGRTVLHVIRGRRRHRAPIALEDEIRPESMEAIDLICMPWALRVAMITGDSPGGRRCRRSTPRHRRGRGAGPPGGQGRGGAALPGGRPAGGDGRRWRERCPGAGEADVGIAIGAGHRCGHRVGRHRPGPRTTRATSSAAIDTVPGDATRR